MEETETRVHLDAGLALGYRQGHELLVSVGEYIHEPMKAAFDQPTFPRQDLTHT